MERDVYTRWTSFIFPALAFVYLQLFRYLDKRFSRKRPLTDQEFLTKMALASVNESTTTLSRRL
jgi:hypothetical protein